MALASFNRASFKKQKPSNSPIVFKFSVHLQECSFNPFRTYTTFNHTLAFKSYYRRFKKCAKPLCKRHRSFPCFPIVSNLLFHLRSTRSGSRASFSSFRYHSISFIPLATHSGNHSVGLHDLPFAFLHTVLVNQII